MRFFPELNGFVIFSKSSLIKHVSNNNIGNDLLKYFREDNDSEVLTSAGIVVPIFDISDGLYEITIHMDVKREDANVTFHSDGEIALCGMGYFCNFDYENLKDDGVLFIKNIPCGLYDLHWVVDEKDEKLDLFLSKRSND